MAFICSCVFFFLYFLACVEIDFHQTGKGGTCSPCLHKRNLSHSNSGTPIPKVASSQRSKASKAGSKASKENGHSADEILNGQVPTVRPISAAISMATHTLTAPVSTNPVAEKPAPTPAPKPTYTPTCMISTCHEESLEPIQTNIRGSQENNNTGSRFGTGISGNPLRSQRHSVANLPYLSTINGNIILPRHHTRAASSDRYVGNSYTTKNFQLQDNLLGDSDQSFRYICSEEDTKRAITPPPQATPPKSVHSDMYDTVFALQSLNNDGWSDYLTKVRGLWDGHMNKRYSAGSELSSESSSATGTAAHTPTEGAASSGGSKTGRGLCGGKVSLLF